MTIGGRIQSLTLNQLLIFNSIFGFMAAIQSSVRRMWAKATGKRTGLCSTTGGREGSSWSSESDVQAAVSMPGGGDDTSIGVGMVILYLVLRCHVFLRAVRAKIRSISLVGRSNYPEFRGKAPALSSVSIRMLCCIRWVLSLCMQCPLNGSKWHKSFVLKH